MYYVVKNNSFGKLCNQRMDIAMSPEGVVAGLLYVLTLHSFPSRLMLFLTACLASFRRSWNPSLAQNNCFFSLIANPVKRNPFAWMNHQWQQQKSLLQID